MKKRHMGRISYKLQTDGYYSGNPSVFVEFFGCNLTCSGLNNQHPKTENPTHYNTIESVDTGQIHTGCDHAHSWNKDYLYLSDRLDLNEIADRIEEVLPNKSWLAPSGKPIHLVFSGGEPLMQQDLLTEILTQLDYRTNIGRRPPLSYVTIETNATLTVKDSTIEFLKAWEKNTKYIENFKREILFANSPKLSNSGEIIDPTASSTVVHSQLANYFKTTFKFVVSSKPKYFTEIEKYFKDISDNFPEIEDDDLALDEINHKLRKALVYISHEAANRDQVNFKELRELGKFCLTHGYILTLRNHLFWQ